MLMFHLWFFSSNYKWGGHKFCFVCVLSVLSQLQAHSSILWYVMLGLEPCKPHFCFASWLLPSLWLTKETARLEKEEGTCSFLMACCHLPVCFFFLCVVSWQHFFTQPAADPSHSNRWILSVVFPTLSVPASMCSIPLHLPITQRHQHRWGNRFSSEIWVSVHGTLLHTSIILIHSTSFLYSFTS